MTVQEILIDWINYKKSANINSFKNSDLDDCRNYAFNRFGSIHNIATYEREFRKLREKYPQRWIQKKEGRQRLWKLADQPKKPKQSNLFTQ
jgi:hypothetical protein